MLVLPPAASPTAGCTGVVPLRDDGQAPPRQRLRKEGSSQDERCASPPVRLIGLHEIAATNGSRRARNQSACSRDTLGRVIRVLVTLSPRMYREP